MSPDNPSTPSRSAESSSESPGWRHQLAVEEREAEEQRRRRVRLYKRVLRYAGLVVLLVTLLAAAAVVFILRRYEAGLPSIEQLKTGYDPPQVTRVLARDATLLASLFTERRTLVAFDKIPRHTKLAFLAAEDAHFYEHEGLNYFGMLRALVVNLRAGHTVQGGSTITQQVVKNVLLDSRRTYRRKIRETLLARRVEQYLTKDEILSLYLNHIYLGHGRYGIEEAARYYFGKSSSLLDLPESALLAGLVAAPERYSPRRDLKKALMRRRYVLDQMLKKGFLASAELRDKASEVGVRLAPAVEAESELAPEVVGRVQNLLSDIKGERKNSGGFTVHTTIDPRLQAAARRAVRENLDRYLERQKLVPPFTLKKRRLWGDVFEGEPRQHGIYTGRVVAVDDGAWTIDVQVGKKLGRVQLKREDRYNPKRLPPSEFVGLDAALRVSVLDTASVDSNVLPLRLELGPQSALVAVDVRSRQVVALVGSYEAVVGGLDRTLSLRQPGSAFKPFLYSFALSTKKVTAASLIEVPSKDSEDGSANITLRRGVATSNNHVAAWTYEKVGGKGVVQWAHSLGITSRLAPTPSLALGAYEVTPVEMAQAYATLASGGRYEPLVWVTQIKGPGGELLKLPNQLPERRAMSPEVAYLTTSLLTSVVKEGTGRLARSLSRPLAGKTGTTNQAKDAWFAGYSTDLVAVVWVGYDDPLPLGRGESGARTALPAWVDFMKVAHEGKPKTQFVKPPGIVTVSIDPSSGLRAFAAQPDAIAEHFLDGTVPEGVAEPAPLDAGVSDASGVPADASPERGTRAPQPGLVRAQRAPLQ